MNFPDVSGPYQPVIRGAQRDSGGRVTAYHMPSERYIMIRSAPKQKSLPSPLGEMVPPPFPLEASESVTISSATARTPVPQPPTVPNCRDGFGRCYGKMTEGMVSRGTRSFFVPLLPSLPSLPTIYLCVLCLDIPWSFRHCPAESRTSIDCPIACKWVNTRVADGCVAEIGSYARGGIVQLDLGPPYLNSSPQQGYIITSPVGDYTNATQRSLQPENILGKNG